MAVIAKSRVRLRPVRDFVVLVLLAMLVCTQAVAESATAATVNKPSPRPVVSIPTGWKTYTYGKASISVPRSWAVKRNQICPNTSAPGSLMLGFSKAGYDCTAYIYPKSWIRIETVSKLSDAGSVFTGGRPHQTVNGVPVIVGFGSPATLAWYAPSLQVELTSWGPNAARIFHTLRLARR